MQPLSSTSTHIIRNSTSGRSASRSSTGRNFPHSTDREKSPVRRKSNGRHLTNSLACGIELPVQVVDDTREGTHSRASGGQHAACHAPGRRLQRLAAIMKLQPRPRENIRATSICISGVEDFTSGSTDHHLALLATYRPRRGKRLVPRQQLGGYNSLIVLLAVIHPLVWAAVPISVSSYRSCEIVCECSIRFYVGEPDRLGPLISIFGDELAECGGNYPNSMGAQRETMSPLLCKLVNYVEEGACLSSCASRSRFC